MSQSLIVRVKRRRSDAPTDSLCIVEDTARAKRADLGRSISKLALGGPEGGATSSDGAEDEDTKRLLLQRVDTLGRDTGDKHAIEATRKRTRASSVGSDGGALPGDSHGMKNMSIYVTHSRRVVKSKKEGSFVVLDLAQVACSSVASVISNQAKPAKKVSSGEGKFKRAQILSPPDRHLEAALNQLLAYGNGPNGSMVSRGNALADFSPVLTAIMQGGNVNLQTAEAPISSSSGSMCGKLTALMLACHFCNARVVNRLLARGADVFTLDEHGDTAMDYLIRTMQQGSNSIKRQGGDLILTLQKAAVASQKHRDALKSIAIGGVDRGGGAALGQGRDPFASTQEGEREGEGKAEDREFVYDIFSTDQPMETETGAAIASIDIDKEKEGQEQSSVPAGVPLVSVQGLRIDSSSGLVEFLEFDYDSDWSDLGDDEDPDSNDERFHGNDYPEEETDEDSDGNGGKRMYLSDEEEDEVSSEEGDERRETEKDLASFRGRPAKLGHTRAGRFATGHVTRPVFVGREGGYIGNEGPRTPSSIRRQWGASQEDYPVEDVEEDEEDDDDVVTMQAGGPMSLMEHRDRLRAAHNNGMGSGFGSNPREFDSRGLPRMHNGEGLGAAGYDDEDDYDGLLGKYGHDPNLDHHSNAQYSKFAYDSNEEEGDDDHANNERWMMAGEEREEQLYAEARKARAFYNGLQDTSGEHTLASTGTTNDHVFRIKRGVASREECNEAEKSVID